MSMVPEKEFSHDSQVQDSFLKPFTRSLEYCDMLLYCMRACSMFVIAPLDCRRLAKSRIIRNSVVKLSRKVDGGVSLPRTNSRSPRAPSAMAQSYGSERPDG